MEENYKQVYLSDARGNVAFFINSLKPVKGLWFDKETGTIFISEKFRGSVFYLNSVSGEDGAGRLAIYERYSGTGKSLWTVDDINNKNSVVGKDIKPLRQKYIKDVIIEGNNNKWFFVLDGILWGMSSKTRWFGSEPKTEHKRVVGLVLLDKQSGNANVDMCEAKRVAIDKGFDCDEAEIGKFCFSGSSIRNMKISFPEKGYMDIYGLKGIENLENMILESKEKTDKTYYYFPYSLANEMNKTNIKKLFCFGAGKEKWEKVFAEGKNGVKTVKNVFSGILADENGKIISE